MSDLDWSGGAPRSRRYDDVYFSAADGLAESRAVFLQGCELPQAWRGRDRFTVAELGFGTGLNILALLDLWRGAREPGARLHVFSVEAFPLGPGDAARALSAWPELADLAAPLLARWPQARGVTRVDWPELGGTLDVVVGEVADALAGWDGCADAWFLDGFAPSRNPEMWRDEVLALVAARSAPEARLATFTVAGAVRRGLQAHGFAVEKRPGHAGKRERLVARQVSRDKQRQESDPAGTEARQSGTAGARRTATAAWARRPPSASGQVAVIGGGIAGAALVRALTMDGVEAVVVSDGASSASRFAAALVEPRLEAGDTSAARLHAQAFARAAALYEAEAPEAVLARGVVKLGAPEESARFDRLAASPLFPPGRIERCDQEDRPALRLLDARVIEPAVVVERWLGRGRRLEACVAALQATGAGWRLLDAVGEVIAEAAAVVVAGGSRATALLAEVTLQPVRGQVSVAPGIDGPPLSWGGYAVPARAGLLFGATHDRGETADEVRRADHLRNLATLAEARPELAARLDPDALKGAAGVRAATPDRLPLAGPVADEAAFRTVWASLAQGRLEGDDPCLQPGLYILGGFGSRGFTTAPLLAEHVAAWITGAPSPLPLDLSAAVHPSRFLVRALRRAGNPRSALHSAGLPSASLPFANLPSEGDAP